MAYKGRTASGRFKKGSTAASKAGRKGGRKASAKGRKRR
jgi:general stress protein YciG